MSARLFLLRAEAFFWAAGAALVLIYAGGRLAGEVERLQGIAEFAERKAQVAEHAGRIVERSAAGGQQKASDGAVPASTVDQSDWAASRIRAHADSVQSDGQLPIAVLRIPRIALEVPVYATLSEHNLNRGAGLVPPVGEASHRNIAIAAHRDGYFRALSRVRIGDWIEYEGIERSERYKIAALTIVEPSDLSPLQPTKAPALTLITCYPFWFAGHAPQRYIVRALLTP